MAGESVVWQDCVNISSEGSMVVCCGLDWARPIQSLKIVSIFRLWI